MSNKHSVSRVEHQNNNSNGSPMPFHIFNIDPEGGVAEKEWSIVATMKQNGEGGNLMRLIEKKNTKFSQLPPAFCVLATLQVFLEKNLTICPF